MLFLRYLFIAGLFFGALSANVLSYQISSPLFGNLGSVEVREHHTKKGTYRIEAELKSLGFASVLTRRRLWHVRSEGRWIKRRRHSRRYTYIEVDKKRKRIREYKIDPVHRKVTKRARTWENGKLKSEESSKLPYYSDEDIATLILNLLSRPSRIKSGRYMVVGAEKRGGYISITLPTKEQAATQRSKLDAKKGDKIIYIFVPRKGKSPRKIVAAISASGELRSAYSVAVPIIGVLYLKRVSRQR